MANRPGFMIFFDTRPALELLTHEQRGILFMAIMDYSEYGEIPEFSDKLLEMAWSLMKPKLDRDAESYNEKCIKNKYSVYCREEKKKGKDPLEFDLWLLGNNNHSISNDIVNDPTIKGTINETIKGIITETITVTETEQEQETEKECKGEGEEKARNSLPGLIPETHNKEPPAPMHTAKHTAQQGPLSEQDFERAREYCLKKIREAHLNDNDVVL